MLEGATACGAADAPPRYDNTRRLHPPLHCPQGSCRCGRRRASSGCGRGCCGEFVGRRAAARRAGTRSRCVPRHRRRWWPCGRAAPGSAFVAALRRCARGPRGAATALAPLVSASRRYASSLRAHRVRRYFVLCKDRTLRRYNKAEDVENPKKPPRVYMMEEVRVRASAGAVPAAAVPAAIVRLRASLRCGRHCDVAPVPAGCERRRRRVIESTVRDSDSLCPLARLPARRWSTSVRTCRHASSCASSPAKWMRRATR